MESKNFKKKLKFYANLNCGFIKKKKEKKNNQRPKISWEENFVFLFAFFFLKKKGQKLKPERRKERLSLVLEKKNKMINQISFEWGVGSKDWRV